MAVTDERVSRRRLLKRAGVGAAVLGAGSMITASTAAAQHEGDAACIDAGGCGVCGGQQDCGDTCSCIMRVDGCCFCHEWSFCSDLPSCSDDHDCPPGWACSYSCCGGGYCHPPCGYVWPSAVQGTGPMSNSGAGAASEPAPEAPGGGHGGHGHA